MRSNVYFLVILLFCISCVFSQESSYRAGTGKLRLDDVKYRRYFIIDPDEIDIDRTRAICYTSIGPVGYYYLYNQTKEEANQVFEWRMTAWKSRRNPDHLKKELGENCTFPLAEFFLNYRIHEEDGLDCADIYALHFQKNFYANFPYSCDDKFRRYFDEVEVIRTLEKVQANGKKSTCFECHPIFVSKNLEFDEKEFQDLKGEIVEKMHQYMILNSDKYTESKDEL